jgi:hypothetical protein
MIYKLLAILFFLLPQNTTFFGQNTIYPVTYTFPGSSLGSSWTTPTGSFLVGANAASGGGSTNNIAYYNIATLTDQYASGSFVRGGGNFIGLSVRITNAGTGGSANGYVVNCGPASSECFLQKTTNGSTANLTSCTSCTSATGTLYLSAVGTTLTVKFNGTSILTTTDSTYTSGSPGIAAYGNPTGTISNWQGGCVPASAC